MLGLIAQVLVGRKIPDLNCGLRAVDRQTALRMLPILPNGFSFETTLTVAMLKAGYPTTWVPIQVAPRIGRSTVRVADGFNMLLLIVRLVSLFSPLRVFLPISGLMLAIGIWYMVESYLLFQEASIKALLAMLASLLFFLFGLLADQIAALRRGEAVLRSGERIAPVPGVAFDRGWRPARSEATVEPAVAPADAVDPTLGTAGVTPTHPAPGTHLLTFDAEHWYEGYRLRGFGGWERIPPAIRPRLTASCSSWPSTISGQRSSRPGASRQNSRAPSEQSSGPATRSRRTDSITCRSLGSAARRRFATICSARWTSCVTCLASRSAATARHSGKSPRRIGRGCSRFCWRKG